MSKNITKIVKEAIEIAKGLQEVCLHGPVPIDSTMKLAEAVLYLEQIVDGQNEKIAKATRFRPLVERLKIWAVANQNAEAGYGRAASYVAGEIMNEEYKVSVQDK